MINHIWSNIKVLGKQSPPSWKYFLTEFVSVTGKVNVTVFVEVPPPWPEHDIDVDLRSWLMLLQGVLLLCALDWYKLFWATVSLQYWTLLLPIWLLETILDPFLGKVLYWASGAKNRFSTEPWGVNSSPSSSKTILRPLSDTFPTKVRL